MSFKEDVDLGLSADRKFLSSKYFYDDEGSRLFQQIMRVPEYYLTNCETEIFTKQADAVAETLAHGLKKVRLIDFGAGDGAKTKLLLRGFFNKGIEVVYTAIDISEGALDTLDGLMHQDFPDLEIDSIHAEYYDALNILNQRKEQLPKMMLFLGSNIGNFTDQLAIDFLSYLHKSSLPDDRLLIGFDLKKDPFKILRAYSDAQHVTEQFNLNLLRRINRELDANFEVEAFDHYATYDPVSGTARSFLISLKEQQVHVGALNKTYAFDAYEPISVEQSQKYNLKEMHKLAAAASFSIVHNFYDSQNFYTDSVWKPK